MRQILFILPIALLMLLPAVLLLVLVCRALLAYIRSKKIREEKNAVKRSLEEALETLGWGQTLDAVSVNIEEALDALGELTGRTAREEIVDRIFSRFCVGK